MIPTCVGKEPVVSQELTRILEVSPATRPTVSIKKFIVAVETACYDTVSWWNSDPSDDGDIPLEMISQCKTALVEEWCDEIDCIWPGPEAGWAVSDAHEASQTAWATMGKDNPLMIGLGDKFIVQFKEELKTQREMIERTQ